MTHLLDTPALLAHYLAESGAERMQALFEDDAVVVGGSILSLHEFELRLHQLGVKATARAAELSRYRALLNEVVAVDEAVRCGAVRLRINATAHLAAMDVLIGSPLFSVEWGRVLVGPPSPQPSPPGEEVRRARPWTAPRLYCQARLSWVRVDKRTASLRRAPRPSAAAVYQ